MSSIVPENSRACYPCLFTLDKLNHTFYSDIYCRCNVTMQRQGLNNCAFNAIELCWCGHVWLLQRNKLFENVWMKCPNVLFSVLDYSSVLCLCYCSVLSWVNLLLCVLGYASVLYVELLFWWANIMFSVLGYYSVLSWAMQEGGGQSTVRGVWRKNCTESLTKMVANRWYSR